MEMDVLTLRMLSVKCNFYLARYKKNGCMHNQRIKELSQTFILYLKFAMPILLVLVCNILSGLALAKEYQPATRLSGDYLNDSRDGAYLINHNFASNDELKTLKKKDHYNQTITQKQNNIHILVALANWPPWKIIDQTGFSGIDVAILKNIGMKLGITFHYTACPWKRCVEKLRKGEVDMITSFSKTPERQKFTEYIDPSYHQEKIVFYKKKGKKVSVKKYKNLYKYKIGKIHASFYFETFNSDIKLNTISVAKGAQLLYMLDAERIDLIVGHEISHDCFLALNGFSDKFEKVSYRAPGTHAYLAISKKSKIVTMKKIIGDTIQQMLESHEIKKIIHGFLNRTLPIGSN